MALARTYTMWSRLFLTCLAVVLSGCASRDEGEKRVVVYASVDQNHGEPVLKAFERKTGTRVFAVHDVEAAKTTGMVNRLIAEKARPQADVFWSGEFAQTILLKEQGVLAPYASANAADIPDSYRDPANYWTGFAGRARVFIVNTDLVAPADYPKSLHDLLDPKWPADKVAIAYPLFGTTATHAAALYAAWGPEKARRFFEQLRARGVRIVPGNSVVRDLVANGRAMWGLTDTDDAAGAIARGAPVTVVFPDQDGEGLGTLVVPNTVALVAGAPHPEQARALIDYMVSREVERRLVESGWCHVPVRECDEQPRHIQAADVKAMQVNLEEVYQQIARVKRELAEIFVK